MGTGGACGTGVRAHLWGLTRVENTPSANHIAFAYPILCPNAKDIYLEVDPNGGPNVFVKSAIGETQEDAALAHP